MTSLKIVSLSCLVKAQAWSEFLFSIRRWLRKKNFLEVHTPSCVPLTTIEPYVDFLPSFTEGCVWVTSPEVSLKKALGAIGKPIYEIRPCFRQEIAPPTPWHKGEFYMLEFYWPHTHFFDFMHETLKFLEDVTCEIQQKFHLSCEVQKKIFFLPDLWQDLTQTPLLPKMDLSDWQGAFSHLLPSIKNYDQVDDVFYALFVHVVEPFLKRQPGFVAVWGFPSFQAAMAQLNTDGWALRFEVYYHGIEIANGYQELWDVNTLKARWAQNNEIRKALGKPLCLWDEEFEAILSQGMPEPTCGISIGLERWLALIFNQDTIENFVWFWHNR